LLCQNTWNDDEVKERRCVQNAQKIDLVDKVFKGLVGEKFSTEICIFLRSHVIRHDQQNKEKAAR
jgi:hypothetical protein